MALVVLVLVGTGLAVKHYGRANLVCRFSPSCFVVLGDSMAAGHGVQDRTLAWNAMLAKRLGRPFVLVAKGGADSAYALAAYRAPEVRRDRMLLIYTGHNNPSALRTEQDIAAIVDTMDDTGQGRRFLVGLPVLVMSHAPAPALKSEILGTRAAIRTRWPDSFVDIPGALLAAAQAQGDTARSDPNIAYGATPSRYLADRIHLNPAGQAVEAAAWEAKLRALRWN